MILKPVTTEKAVKLIEMENTLIFEVGRRYKKEEIKKEAEEMFNIKVGSIRTLIRNNKKRCYIQLKKSQAIDLATKLGMM